MSISYWQKNQYQVRNHLKSDVVIIGAGIAGLSTAYWLKEMSPGLSITIIDRSFVGAGASGRNAGFLTIGSSYFYFDLIKKFGNEKAFSIYQFAKDSVLGLSKNINSIPTSSLTILKNEQDKVELKKIFSSEWQFSFDHTSKVPGLNRSLMIHPNEFKVIPTQLIATLRGKLEKQGVNFIEGVSAFKIDNGHVYTDEVILECSSIVLAMNAYLSEFSDDFKNIIIPNRAQMLAVKLESKLDVDELCYDPLNRVYWRKTHSDELIIGGKRLLDESREVSNFEKVTQIIQDGLEDYLGHELGIKYHVIKRWSGIMGFTQDELPIITKVNKYESVYVLGGFSGHGMGFGFKSGFEMANLVLKNKKFSFFDLIRKIDK